MQKRYKSVMLLGMALGCVLMSSFELRGSQKKKVRPVTMTVSGDFVPDEIYLENHFLREQPKSGLGQLFLRYPRDPVRLNLSTWPLKELKAYINVMIWAVKIDGHKPEDKSNDFYFRLPPENEQVFMFNGKVFDSLDSDKTLSELGIKEGNTIIITGKSVHSAKNLHRSDSPDKKDQGKFSSTIPKIAGATALLVALTAVVYKVVQRLRARRGQKQSMQTDASSEQSKKHVVAALVKYLTLDMGQSERESAIALVLKPYDAATQDSLLAEARAQVVVSK